MPTLEQLAREARGESAGRPSVSETLRAEWAVDEALRRVESSYTRRASDFETPLDLLRSWQGSNYVHGRHFDAMNEHLVALARREITGLMISLPPQHGKSTFGSVAFPAWYFGQYPQHNIIQTGYNTTHAQDFGRRARDLILDPHYSRRLGVRVDPANRGRGWWSLVEGGRMATFGLDGGITGKPADLINGDDPHKNAVSASSDALKLRLRSNWQTACETRLAPGGIRLLIATRWRRDDLIGWLLEEQPEQWTFLNLPAIARSLPDPAGRTRVGEALWPEKGYTEAEYKSRRSRIGEYAWSAMYQGIPQRREPDSKGLIPANLVEEARTRQPSDRTPAYWGDQPVSIGLDVAAGGSDNLAVAILKGGELLFRLVEPASRDLMKTAYKAVELIKEYEAASIRIDDTGVGRGVSSRLQELQRGGTAGPELRRCDVIPINFGSAASDSELYANVRTEMYVKLHERLKARTIGLPGLTEDDADELCAPAMIFSRNNRQILEPKLIVKRRLGRSPDFADALVLAAYPEECIVRVGVW